MIIGVDEVGRGPLAGPVVAAAVTLKKTQFKNRIDDSKKLSSRQREMAFQEIIGQSIFGIGIIHERLIDRINIHQATCRAMQQAIRILFDKLNAEEKKNSYELVDGNLTLNIGLPYSSIIRGDSKSLSIASASILAKVLRDRIMSLYDKLYPAYGFLEHKGYPTQVHRDALRRLGPSLIHRISFHGV